MMLARVVVLMMRVTMLMVTGAGSSLLDGSAAWSSLRAGWRPSSAASYHPVQTVSSQLLWGNGSDTRLPQHHTPWHSLGLIMNFCSRSPRDKGNYKVYSEQKLCLKEKLFGLWVCGIIDHMILYDNATHCTVCMLFWFVGLWDYWSHDIAW